eukprot:gene32285-39864_t
MPTGLADEGEDISAAAEREVFEETDARWIKPEVYFAQNLFQSSPLYNLMNSLVKQVIDDKIATTTATSDDTANTSPIDDTVSNSNADNANGSEAYKTNLVCRVYITLEIVTRCKSPPIEYQKQMFKMEKTMETNGHNLQVFMSQNINPATWRYKDPAQVQVYLKALRDKPPCSFHQQAHLELLSKAMLLVYSINHETFEEDKKETFDALVDYGRLHDHLAMTYPPAHASVAEGFYHVADVMNTFNQPDCYHL